MKQPFDLAGRVAVVTGAGSGIGRATAVLFAELGAKVVATDVNLSTVEETVAAIATGTAVALRHDVTSETDWAEVFAHVSGQIGRLDILVNNAGVMVPGPFEGAPIEHLRRQQKINVESVFIGMQGAIPLMKASISQHAASPSMINVSSIYGQVAGARFAAYSASKGAVRMLTKAVANELAPAGIRVNSIHPGPTETNLAADWDPSRDPAGNLIPKEVITANWMRLIPMRRMGAAGDITGAELTVDGGYTAI